MNSNFYLIYDNGMKIVKDNRVYAIMDRNGNMAEHDIKTAYYYKEVKAAAASFAAAAPAPAAVSSTPGMEYDMSGVLNDVDRLLKEACTWQD